MFNEEFSMKTFHRILADADALLDAADSAYLEAVAEAGDYLDRHLIGFMPTPFVF
jgi:hypothetical protein